MTALQMEKGHVEIGLAPVADAFAGTVNSDVFSLKNHGRIRFLVVKGAGAVGTFTVTVEACDDFVPTTQVAVPFRYRRCVAGQAPGAMQSATAAGFTTTAAANDVYEIEVAAAALLASGYPNVRLHTVEVANDPVLGGILAELLEPRFANSPATATA